MQFGIMILVVFFLITIGYVNDKEATAMILDSEGWLRTGDICYFDSEGFVYVVDRLKELIKYKGYQVVLMERSIENQLFIHQLNDIIFVLSVLTLPDTFFASH